MSGLMYFRHHMNCPNPLYVNMIREESFYTID